MGGAHSPPLRGGVARQLNRSWRAGREARARAKRKRDSAQPQEKHEASINGQFGETLRQSDHYYGFALSRSGFAPVCAASVALRRYAFLHPFLLARELARNHNRLGFHVIVESFRAVLFTQAALLQAAKRQLIENDLRRVDPRIAGFESFGSPRCLVEVARPYRRPETVDGVVRLFECFIEIFHTHDRQRRTKYFLLNDSGFFIDIHKDRR